MKKKKKKKKKKERKKKKKLNVIVKLKVQSCKLHNNKYMIASAQITNVEIFAFIAVLVFKLLSRQVLFINGNDNRIY